MTTQPGSPEWNRTITASKVAAILGVSPWESPRSIWHKMRGDIPPEPQSSVQSRGHFLEPAILAWWQAQHPEVRYLMGQREFKLNAWAAATPDGVACTTGLTMDDAVALVEAKSTNSLDDWGDPGTDEIPTYYLVQVVWQMHVSGIHRCYVPIIGPRLEFAEYVVDYEPEWGQQLEDRIRVFYDSLKADDPPPLDDTVATYEAVRKVHPDIKAGIEATLTEAEAVEFVEAIATEKAATARARAAKSLVIAAMGNAQYAVCNGTRIARRQPAKSGVAFYPVAKTTDFATTEEPAA